VFGRRDTGMQNGLRVAIYSQDGFGLGHLRRTTLIGGHLLANLADSAVLLFADSPVAPSFELPYGMDFVKLPSILKRGPARWEPVSLPIGARDLEQLRAGLLRQALLDFRPDVLLVDHMPGGVQGELIPALDGLKRMHPDCRIVLGLRDILDSPEVTVPVWSRERVYDVLREYYHAILIYGAQDVFDTAGSYCLPAMPEGVHYCGYVVNRATAAPTSSLSGGDRSSGDRLVYVCVGGGGDGAHLQRTYLRAIRSLGRRVDFTTLMALGPNSPHGVRRELREEARGLPVEIVTRVEDSAGTTAAADLIVCMAGYNTLCEVLYRRRKALVVPRSGPSREQRMRAGILTQRGLVDCLDPDQLCRDALSELLLQDLERNDYPVNAEALPMDGAQMAVNRLTELTHAGCFASI
jgi:predicted glycosyltransferase